MTAPWTNRQVVRHVEARYWFDDVQFVCSWPLRGRGQIMTNVSIESTGVNGGVIVPKVRINLLSSSARSGLFRNHPRREELDAMWLRVVSDLHHWYEQELSAASNPDPKQHREQRGGKAPWLIYPFWPAEGATGIVASHESLKTYSGIAAALSVTTGSNFFGGNSRVSGDPRKVLYLDWEADVGSFADRMGALMEGAGVPLEPILTHIVMRDSIVDATPMLVERIQVGGYQAVVVDSMSASIGGQGLVGDDSVNAFWDAIRSLNVPALVLAHKSAQSGRTREARFFGSVMSEARVRMAWNVEVEDPGHGSTSRKVLWTCFKDNNHGSRGNRLAWQYEFFTEGEHEAKMIDAVTIDAINPNSVRLADRDGMPSEAKSRGPGQVHQDIVSLLGRSSGPVMKAKLIESTGKSPNTVSKTLRRMVDAGVVVNAGNGAYTLAGSQARTSDLDGT